MYSAFKTWYSAPPAASAKFISSINALTVGTSSDSLTEYAARDAGWLDSVGTSSHADATAANAITGNRCESFIPTLRGERQQGTCAALRACNERHYFAATFEIT